jgi:hypothetical protein
MTMSYVRVETLILESYTKAVGVVWLMAVC